VKKPEAKTQVAKPAPKLSGKSNLEIDQNADLVIGNAASSKGIDDQTKDVLAAVAQSAQSLSEAEAATMGETEKLKEISNEIEAEDKSEDLSVPKWPKYTDPASQQAEIQAELKDVKKQHAHWKSLYDASLKQS
jgi:hypothetical protein